VRDSRATVGPVAENVGRVRDRIAEAAQGVGRSPDEIDLMAVTKARSPAEVAAVVSAGIALLGENRVQEAREKKPRVDADATWHMIGHLQTNKINHAVDLFDAIQSVDSTRLAERLSRRASAMDRTMTVLVEVNTSGEASKSGASPDGASDIIGAILDLPGLGLSGLMTIGAFVDDESRVRACFAALRGLRDRAETQFGIDLPVLSMGMTGDFPWAVAEGATLVRVGTALFGPRPRA